MPSGILRLFLRFLERPARWSSPRLCRPEVTGPQEEWNGSQNQHGFLSNRGGLRTQEKTPHETAAKVSPLRPGSVPDPAAQEQHTPDPQPVRIKRHTQGDLPVTPCSRVQRLCQRSLVRAEVYPPHRIVLTEAKLKRDRFRAAPQNDRRRKAFSPFKTCRSAERKRKRSRLPTGGLRPSERKYEF